MSTEKEAKALAVQTPATAVTRSQHWRIVFTNTFHMNFGDNDVKISFGVDLASAPNRNVVEECIVAMTPRSAKMLGHTLQLVVANFEAVNGPISVPAGRMEKITKGLEEQFLANQARRKQQEEAAKKESGS